MKKFILSVILFFCILIPAFALGESLNGIINISFEQNHFKTVVDTFGFNKMSDTERLELMNSMIQSPNEYIPFTFVMLSDAAFQYNRDMGAVFYIFGAMRTAQDVAMCNNPNAFALLRISDGFSSNVRNALNTNPQYYSMMLNSALDWNKRFPSGIEPYWACDSYYNPFAKGKSNKLPISEYEDIKVSTLRLFETLPDFSLF